MPIQIQGSGGVTADVGGTTFRAMKVGPMPVEHGALGHYQASMVSGTLAAALAASAVLFSFRWSDATRLAVIQRIRARFMPLTPFTAATLTDFGFDAFVGRSFSAAHTGGTAATLTGNSFKMRTSMGTTLLNDMRMASTAALGGGTITVDGNAFASSIGRPQRTNPAAATEETIQPIPVLEWDVDMAHGEHPIVLAASEGFVIRNRTVWPVAGTGILQVECKWAEVAAF